MVGLILSACPPLLLRRSSGGSAVGRPTALGEPAILPETHRPTSEQMTVRIPEAAQRGLRKAKGRGALGGGKRRPNIRSKGYVPLSERPNFYTNALGVDSEVTLVTNI